MESYWYSWNARHEMFGTLTLDVESCEVPDKKIVWDFEGNDANE